MNHHEALGRYIELKEASDAAQVRRQALLNSLARAADHLNVDRTASFDFAAARALLDGAEFAQNEAATLEGPLRAAAEACGKKV